MVHDGDIKPSAGLPCSAQLFADRHRLFTSIVAPMILAFGDNDWRDCASPGDPPSVQVQDQQRALTWLRREFVAFTDNEGNVVRLTVCVTVLAPGCSRWPSSKIPKGMRPTH